MWPFRKKDEDDFSSGRFSIREAESANPPDEGDDNSCASDYGYRYLERFHDTGTILFEIVDEDEDVCGYITCKPEATPVVLFDERWNYEDTDVTYLAAEVQKFMTSL